jgi:catechol 2,3-dioxygenase
MKVDAERSTFVRAGGEEREGHALTIPTTNLHPPFNVTRASHVYLTTPDLAASLAFYSEVIGLAVSAADADTAYLRGVEEVCHHSLVLARSDEAPTCEAVGYRVFEDADLDRAKAYFDASGFEARWVERPFEARTLRVVDANRIPVELCARMEPRRRFHVGYERQKGAGALRLDHFQIVVPDVATAARFYTDIGFRVSDYFTDDRFGDHVFGAFLFRKGNPHDTVFLTRAGPRFHHFGYVVPEVADLYRGCDIAGNLGFGNNIEHGPGRHGQGHARYVYYRDPAGHRVETLTPPIQIIDLEDEPVRWEQKERFQWGRPPPRTWLEEATVFAGVEPTEPEIQQPPPSQDGRPAR